MRIRPLHLNPALVAIGLLAGLVASPALAGETRTWDNDRYTAKGHGKASVTIDFLNQRTFDIQGYVEDKCPKDGYGAYLKVRYDYRFTATGSGSFTNWATFKDSNGCGNGTVPFDPAPVSLGKGYKLLSVTTTLCYEDKNGDGTGAVVLNACVPQKFSNWRVR